MNASRGFLRQPVASERDRQAQGSSQRFAVMIFFVSVVGFGLSVLAVQTGVTDSIDFFVHAWVREHRGTVPIRIARDITDLGSTAMLTLLTPVAMVILLRFRGGHAALHPAIAGLVSYASIRFLKEAVGRPRPPLEDHLVEVLDPSFPSGHATGIAALLTVVTIHTLAPDASRGERTLLIAAYVVVALSIGWTRVELGVHYVTDVIGGLFLGVICGVLPMLPTTLLARRPSKGSARHSRFV